LFGDFEEANLYNQYLIMFTEQFQPFNLELLGVRLPEINISNEERIKVGAKPDCSNYDYLRALCLKGFKEKIASGEIEQNKQQIYIDRVKEELKVLKDNGIVDYYLLVHKILSWCDENDIARGVGRGSSASSLVFYLIGCIVNVDPIKYKLPFTRFISEARLQSSWHNNILYHNGSSLPDFDADFSYRNRSKVISKINEWFSGKTTKIGTENTFTGKLCVKEVGKAYLELSEEEVKEVASYLAVSFGRVEKLHDAYYGDEQGNVNEQFKKWVDSNPRHKKALTIFQKLEKLQKNKGKHPSGIGIGFYSLDETVPLEFRKKTKDDDDSGIEEHDYEIATSYNMKNVAQLLVKFDALGLKNADLNHETAKLVGVDYQKIDVNHASIYEFLSSKDLFYGLFQIEDGLTKKTVLDVKPVNLEQLSACISLSRPGVFKAIPQYVDFVQKGILKEWGDPKIDNILKETANIIIYQETINRLAIEVYDFSGVDAEAISYCITDDTRFVSKTRGWITLRRLLNEGYQDDLFLVMDEKGHQQWKPISNIWSMGKKQTHYVRARNGMYVRATQWHQFLTDDGWKAKKYLTKDDFLVCAKSVHYDGKDTISPDFSIILAGFITEGYFVSQNSGATFTNWDAEIMSTFLSAFEREFGKDSIALSSDGRVARIRKKEKDIISRVLFPSKSRLKRLPEEMMGMTKETTAKFLGFMFDCEATVSPQRLYFTSASYQLIQQIQLLLLRFNIRTNKLKKFNKKYQRYYYNLHVGQHSDVIRFNNEIACYMGEAKRKIINNYASMEIPLQYTTEVIPRRLMKKYNNQYGYTCNKQSGTAYTKNISFSRFKEIAPLSKDKYWIDLSNGLHEYTKVESTNDLYERDIEVYDFSIDEETPYIIANGLVIHNCIRKKKKDDIKKWEPILFEKGRNLGINEDATKRVWETILASADYQFCAGHAFSYSVMTATNTYFKANYPKEFFLSLLEMAIEEPKPFKAIANITKELPYFGIKLLPPDLLKSHLKFTIEGDNIRYGLKSIKNISEKVSEKLIKFRQEYSSKINMFLAAKEAGIAINVLSALIQAGAMSSYEGNKSRSFLVLQANLFNILTEKEKLLIKQLSESTGEDNIFILVKKCVEELKDEKGRSLIKDSRFNTIKKKIASHKEVYAQNSKNEALTNFLFEKVMLGYSYSQKLDEIYKAKNENILSLAEVKQSPDKTPVFFVGIVQGKIVSKKSKKGSPYIKFTVTDQNDSLECFVFDTSYGNKIQECKDNNSGALPKDNDIVVITGTKKDKDAVYADTIGIQQHSVFINLRELQKVKDSENNLENPPETI